VDALVPVTTLLVVGKIVRVLAELVVALVKSLVVTVELVTFTEALLELLTESAEEGFTVTEPVDNVVVTSEYDVDSDTLELESVVDGEELSVENEESDIVVIGSVNVTVVIPEDDEVEKTDSLVLASVD